MKKITSKLILFYVALNTVAAILAFLLSVPFTNAISGEIRQNQRVLAEAIKELHSKTDLSTYEIINLSSGSMLEVKIIKNPRVFNVSDEELHKVESGDIVHLQRMRLYNTLTMLKADDSYLLIRLHPDHTILKVVASRVGFSLLSLIFIGTLFILLFAKKAVRPVIKLNWATKEVARGNFDIQLKSSSEDEIGQLTQNFNTMVSELKSIEYLRKDFITNVSHEFKTPIASIIGFANLLKRGNLTCMETQEYAEIIAEEAERLSNLSSTILKLSKLENQQIIKQKKLFSLDEQIRRSILILDYEWNRKNVEFEIDLEKIDYFGDEELMDQVWLNLIGNAIKFSHNQGKITILLKKYSDKVVFNVIDEGIGMNEETAARAFEKFYQGDRTHSREGVGLGLSIVKRILDIFGGKICIKSKIKEGSTITVELPLV